VQPAALAAKADLIGGKLDPAQVPDIAIQQYLGVVATQAAMLALVGQAGDWCSRSDTGTVFIITGSPAVIGGWTQLSYPASAVQSVCSLVGVITVAQLGAALAGLFASAAQGGKADTALQPGALPAGTTLPVAQIGNAGAAGRAILQMETLAEIQSSVSGAKPGVIVILGSSNAAGWGAGSITGVDPAGPAWASPPTSWAGLLTSTLSPLGFSVINRSVGGSDTAASIARFVTDVVPHRPEYVFLSTGLFNEPNSLGSKAQCNAAAVTYLRNISTLVRMCESIGAKVILSTVTPRNHGNGDAYAAAKSVSISLCEFGYPVADFTSTMDDGSGGFVAAAATIDGAHVGDVGHLHYYYAIEPSWFTCPGALRIPHPGVGAIAVQAGNTFDGPQIEVLAQYPISSWCISANIRAPASASAGKAFLGVYAYTDPSKTVRVRNPSSVYELAADATTVTLSTVNPTIDTSMHEITVRYNALLDSMTCHIDGIPIGGDVAIGSGRAATTARMFFAGATVGGGATGYAFSGAAVWRSPLSAGSIYIRQVTGVKAGQSMIFDCAAPYVSGVLSNRANGSVAATVNGAFGFA
jgi:hypothetical protein